MKVYSRGKEQNKIDIGRKLSTTLTCLVSTKIYKRLNTKYTSRVQAEYSGVFSSGREWC